MAEQENTVTYVLYSHILRSECVRTAYYSSILRKSNIMVFIIIANHGLGQNLNVSILFPKWKKETKNLCMKIVYLVVGIIDMVLRLFAC